MNNKGKRNNQISQAAIHRAIKKSMEDQRALLAKAKRILEAKNKKSPVRQ